ncbi:hypothetical protein ONE63_011100 [Megalurothrips usitatus]|uniref:Uncharacterized protein n=1 Tax=Megalurothrips usitatus TaxID=439358 RepID=A0AAV7XHY1_9NEOP|nr:hypothetical protein ONE63_011100 [Megalurothrips usitatus]
MQPGVKILKDLAYSAFRDRKDRDVWYYSANTTLLKTTGDENTAALNLASWSSRGGWKDNAHLLASPKICSNAKALLSDVWRSLSERCSSRTTFGECPVKQGPYTCTNVSTNFDFDFPPSFFYGKWRGTAKLYNTQTKEVSFCMRAYFSTAPKANNGPKRKPLKLDLVDKVIIN